MTSEETSEVSSLEDTLTADGSTTEDPFTTTETVSARSLLGTTDAVFNDSDQGASLAA
jgi:hypothetical protein